MRLINIVTLKLEEFFDEEIPKYAILSHTWGEEEVTFQDITSAPSHYQSKAGYLKILGTCSQAKIHGLSYAWVDTCCIDKSSSAELSESINSMFVWYNRAEQCFVYLSDVVKSNSELKDLEEEEIPTPKEQLPERVSEFAASRWFTRGWTLQELLAPDNVSFFDSSWILLGHRSSLHRLLSIITRIDDEVLLNPRIVQGPAISAATKMSWASKRATKRVEDRAYSLLGIFGVHMPLLYGEGPHAFVRLQEEIIRSSDDESIFAWDRDDDCLDESGGLLARSPDAFYDGARIVGWSDDNLDDRHPYNLTNKGLRICLPLLEDKERGLYIAVLACRYRNDFRGPIGLRLDSSFAGDHVYEFTSGMGKRIVVVDLAKGTGRSQTIYIRQGSFNLGQRLLRMGHTDTRYHSKCLISSLGRFLLTDLAPAEYWNRAAMTLWVPMRSTVVAGILMSDCLSQSWAIVFGYGKKSSGLEATWVQGSIIVTRVDTA
jgi:hypothetical protein